MAAKQYIATAKGYVDGRVIQVGEAFTYDFRELVRDESAKPLQLGRKGKDGEWERAPVYPIKRDKEGNAVFKAGEAPSWAEEATKQDYAAAVASDKDASRDDVNLSELSVTELRAHAVGLPIDVTGLKTKEELLAAIAAWNDPRR